MVGAVILAGLWVVSGLCFNWFVHRATKVSSAFNARIKVLETENLRLARAILALEQRLCRIDGIHVELAQADVGVVNELRDHEARIAFCEGQLTAKTSSPKIVPKAHNWKQFRSAAEKASENEQESA